MIIFFNRGWKIRKVSIGLFSREKGASMSTFSIISLPMFAVGLGLMTQFYSKKDLNFLVPGVVLMTAGLVNTLIGIGTS